MDQKRIGFLQIAQSMVELLGLVVATTAIWRDYEFSLTLCLGVNHVLI